MIPEFDERGNLPPGIHHATWTEIVTRYATQRSPSRASRRATRRAAVVEGRRLSHRLPRRQLRHLRDTARRLRCLLGVSGSADLDRLDLELRDFSDRRAAQKARYGGELFPAEWPAQADGTTYLDYFQRDHKGRGKGVVAIDLTGLP
jgi:hypothetical protein